MLYLNDNYVTVWKAESKGKYYEIQMSSSRKDKKSGEYVNSGWSFVRFVAQAAEKAAKLERGDRIILKGAAFSRESYMKDNEKLWPKNPQLVVFNFEWVDEDRNTDSGETEKEDEAPVVEDEMDGLPF